MFKLHQGSIRSSPGDGLNAPCRFTKIQCWTVTVGLLHNVLIYMGQLLQLQLPFVIFLADYLMFSLLLSTWNELGHLPDTQGY